MKISMPVNLELLSKIDSIKQRFGIEISSYSEVIDEMCDILLEKNKLERKEVKNFKALIDEIFKFLLKKVNEVDYIHEDFFKDLIKIYENITDSLVE